MPLPINLGNLIENRTIESDRIEYKKGWNPERILHTICAFANDIENTGGGYIIIGIEEDGSRPKTVIGLTSNEISDAESELASLCNLVVPRYFPIISEETFHEKRLLVIWAPSGDERPYRCPIKIGNRKNDENGYYIRRSSNTIRANRHEELELLSMSRYRSFDDSINTGASVSDIRLPLIKDFLNRVGSDMANESLDMDAAVKSMGLARGPPEASRPLNIALMMFNDHPEQFFPYAWIDVVLMPDPTGESMEERTFKGPVYLQIIEALRFIKNSVIAERIYKTSDRPESLRVFNYPFEAVREAVVNAAYHRDYRISEQITITVTPEHMEIKSFPGPDRGNTDDDLKNLKMHSTFYRNKRLGDYLKELGLTEGRNTGIPKMLRSLRNNGSNPPEFLTDPSRTYLRVIIPIHERFLVTNPLMNRQPAEPIKRLSREEIKERIVRILETRGCIPTKEIMSALGYKSTSRGAYEAIKELLSNGDIVYLYPDSPQDSRQRLCMNPNKRQE